VLLASGTWWGLGPKGDDLGGKVTAASLTEGVFSKRYAASRRLEKEKLRDKLRAEERTKEGDYY
jgi:hypothetical protein